MKVYGTTTTPRQSWGATTSQARVIVAASSRKNAAAAVRGAGLSYSDYAFGQWWAVTGNPFEIATASTDPGTVFWANDGGSPEKREYLPAAPPNQPGEPEEQQR